MYLLKLPAVAHGGDHLGELVLVTLEDPVDVLPSILPTQIVPGRYPATVSMTVLATQLPVTHLSFRSLIRSVML